MYLRGGQWNLRRKSRKPSNPITIMVLLVMIAGAWYFAQFEAPTFPERFQPTRTPTRSPESYLQEGRQLFDAGKLKQAIEAYGEAITVDPGNPAIYTELARLQVFDGQYEDAVDSAEKALILNSNYSDALAVKGWALDYLGDYLNAEGSAKKAIELDGSNAAAYAYLAEILMDADPFGNLDAASEASKQAKAMAPNTLESYRARGYVLENTGNYEEAVQEYKAAIAINDKLWELHYRLGLVYYYMEDYTNAAQEFNLALSFSPNDPGIPRELARVAAAAGQYGKAVQYAEQSVKLDPTNPIWHAVLGFMLYREGQDYERASKEMGLFVHGGTTDDGEIVEGVPLKVDGFIDFYYSAYVLSLTQQDRCNEAVPIIQLILQNVNEAEISYANASIALDYCQNGPATPEPQADSSDE